MTETLTTLLQAPWCIDHAWYAWLYLLFAVLTGAAIQATMSWWVAKRCARKFHARDVCPACGAVTSWETFARGQTVVVNREGLPIVPAAETNHRRRTA